ncbi:MAG TPA: hypothetical protein VFZ91_03140 [Allosphingosinicella sp.]
MGKLAMLPALAAALLAPSALAADAARRETAVAAIPAPPAGMGQVVFYRSPNIGTLIGCRVHEDGEVVNRLPHGTYFIHPTTPGIHEYELKTDLLRVEVEEGETQYVRCRLIGAGWPDLSLRNRTDFERLVRALDLVPPWTGDKGTDD